ncbi:MAG: acetyl-CoA carboxylase biotin carboxyl carrier protein subunit [Candidatus Cloacimonetes bacterium]|jgi:glutaconyl-CoA/methylmalonyl-CoA decarboxylase subunit gamma|nr:acetyl-CoA carboxylase biotin carboxyl carrier protein subunit [Candidatus Cloacimonadota bacterium]MBT6993693.1 acetyl-CoA carboxylase biotin carboxyl carrier protein subunit [Candidatus Cloacimonadota bacterium]MBT7469636.1 acetyl-CoA carboxylase biotin carboxyl carrier protein subunit [Candidatus Cloacimonadota bacterium]
MKKYKFTIKNEKYETRIVEYHGDSAIVEVNGIKYEIDIEQEKQVQKSLVRTPKKTSQISVPKKIVQNLKTGVLAAPIPGLVLKLLVKEGDKVISGQPVLILEAMKMESEIVANVTGIIKLISVKEGDSVQEQQTLLEIGE